MNKITKKLCSLLLIFALALPFIPVVSVSAETTEATSQATTQATTKQHNKQVIGYITQWDAWKTTNAGLPAQGALTHLNIDYSKYTILNYSFFGVANDGSLHSGDFRNKNIYQPGVQQAPAPLLYTDVYSSWDLLILFGETEAVYTINADVAARATAQGFDVVEWGNTWSNPSWGVYNQALPLPLKKEGGAPGLLELAKQNGVKVNASIGGWSMCKHFSEVAADPVKRAKFIQDCVRLINMGFDGIDLDWEYPGPFDGMNFTGSQADYANFTTLTREIRATIGNDKLITSCFSADTNRLENIDWNAVDQYVDYYNFMTYDFNGGWSDKAGHNTPLYSYSNAEAPNFNWDYLYNFLVNKGLNLSKVNMGVAFYGRGVVTNGSAALNAATLKRQETVQPDGPVSTCADYTNWPKEVYDGTPYYYYIKQTALAPNSGWTKHWDDEAKVPYLTKGNFFLSYDDEQSIGYKAQYIKDKNLAGVIVWTVYEDLELSGSVTNYGAKLKKWSNINSPLANKINDVFASGIQSVASPTFSPAAGTYSTAQNVTINCATTDAAIRYTTNGNEPTATSALYNGAINVASTTTLKAKAFKVGMNDSATTTANYIINEDPIDTVASPTFSPTAGTYSSAQNVTINCATTDATIRYTTNGNEPTATSSLYNGAINVASTSTLKAKAFKTGMNDSSTAIANYIINDDPIDTVASPTFSPAAGTYSSAQNVTINCATADATIRYTTNGNEPTATSSLYNGAINVASTSTLKAKAFKAGMNDSVTTTASYTITSGGIDTGTPNGVPATPQLAHNNWDGNASYTITFNIWWGNNATSYKLYENNVVVDTGSLTANSPNGQSKVFNFSNKANGTYPYKIELTNSYGTTTSSVATVNVTKGSVDPIQTVATPTFNPAGGTYSSAQNVTINCATTDATIRYTTNGNEPTATSTLYNGAISIAATSTLKAKAFKASMNNSATATAVYTIVVDPINTVATPTFNPAGGTYSSAQNVTINCATTDATIRYTTNGNEPTATSTLYNGAISIAATSTLKAKAFKADMNNSATATASYTIVVDPINTVATPTFNPAGGTYSSAQTVTINCATTDATIRYTTNGNEPTATSTLYNGAISIAATSTLKAKAFKADMNNSSTATAIYTIESNNVTPWAPYTAYKQGDLVSYNGINYECRQPHTSLPGWEPPNVPALWLVYTGPVDPIETVAAPAFNPAGGTYSSAQTVTMNCDTAGATIRYTTNGAEPTESSTGYNGAISISTTTTLKAKAFKAGMNASTTTTASYTIVVDPIDTVATPTFNPAGGTYLTTQNVSINCTTVGATIRYTTNNTEPTESSAIVNGAISIAATSTLKAKAFKAGMTASTTSTANYIINDGPVTDLPAHILTGYWQNFDNGATCLKISDVPTTYNLIAVAFADSTTTPGAVTFNLDTTLSSRLGGYTKQQFISDIAAAKTRGQKVIISVGGELGSVRIDSATAATNFANSIYALMQEYGFDGVDIDLENGVNATYMASALRQLRAKAGSSLIIAMAPQTLDMQNVNTEYFKLALSIKDILTVVNTQYYNSGSMLGQDGNVYSQGTVDFMTALAAIQLENGLRPDQVGLGLPASSRGAGGGYVAPSVVNSALNCLAKGTASGGSYVPPQTYPTLRGAMTWSINWDALNNYNFANTVAPTIASLGDSNPIQTVATPTFSVATGTAPKTLVVSMLSATSGASIRYTTNGTVPNSSSTLYTGPVTISATTSFIAKAFKSGMNDSATAAATYTIDNGNVSGMKIIGYYPSWEPDKLDRIQYDVLTHINYAFAIPTAQGTLLPLDNPQTASSIIAQAHANNVKVLIAVGGWSYKDTPLENTFVQATNTDAKIATFTNSIMNMVNQYGFDGVDMDWEHPRTGAASQTQYQKLMLSLSSALKASNKLLSSAVLSGVTPDGVIYYDSAAHTDAVLNAVDYINVMAYDGGDGDRHSSYSFAVNCGNYWKNTRNMPASKVVLGVPFYGRPSWASYDAILQANPNAYNTDISMINGLQAYYNGIPTIQSKTTWSKQNVGGIMIWELSQDTLDRSKSLLSAIGQAAQ